MIEASDAPRARHGRDEEVGRELPDVAVRYHRYDERVALERYRARVQRGMELHGFGATLAPRATGCARVNEEIWASKLIIQEWGAHLVKSRVTGLGRLTRVVSPTKRESSSLYFFLFFPPAAAPAASSPVPPPSSATTDFSSSSSPGSVRSSPLPPLIASSMNGDPYTLPGLRNDHAHVVGHILLGSLAICRSIDRPSPVT